MSKLDQSKSEKSSKFNISQFNVIPVSSPTKAEMGSWNSFTIGIDEKNTKLYIKGKSKTLFVTLTEL